MKKPSKQEQAKQTQCYTSKPSPPTCDNCQHFLFEEKPWRACGGGPGGIDQVNMRCGVGGFKVLKKATCLMHKRKDGA